MIFIYSILFMFYSEASYYFADGKLFAFPNTNWKVQKQEQGITTSGVYSVEFTKKNIKGLLMEESFELGKADTAKAFQSSKCRKLAKAQSKKVLRLIEGEQCWVVGPSLQKDLQELTIIVSSLKGSRIFYRKAQFTIKKEALSDLSVFSDLVTTLGGSRR